MNRIKKFLMTPTPFKRAVFFVLADAVIFLISIYLSYAFKFGWTLQHPNLHEGIILKTIILFGVIKFAVYYKFRLYQFTWSYVGLNDLYNILKANTVSFFIIIFFYFLGFNTFLAGLPKSVILADYFISFIMVGFLRISKRLYIEIFKPVRQRRGKRTIIIGAGSEGEMILRDLRKQNFSTYFPVGILDDDKKKWGFFIHDIQVLGPISQLEKEVKKHDVEAVFVADHQLGLKVVQDIYTKARELGIRDIKIVPRLYSVTDVEITVKRMEDIHIEDLINRQEIKVDVSRIREFIARKRVLITGAAGSIGSELVRQVSLFGPEQVILFEIDETEIFYLERELQERFPEMADRFVCIVGDVRDAIKLENVMQAYQPQLIFHAAAYKHVPLMETNPEEALKVNVVGTYNLCKLAAKYGVEKMINISTDKAVKPASVMGGTKRIGEYIARAFNESEATRYISVRFGNVLGSRGSVVPIFLEQLRKGGPLTVTHKEMRRYFMTIPEAVTLVLQAAVLGKGGEIMVLDMGEPVYINKLAEELIRLHGLVPYKDIDIVYTGIRPGEKLFEEILTAEEGTTNTTHERVFVANISADYRRDEIEEIVRNLELMLEKMPKEKLKQNILSVANVYNEA